MSDNESEVEARGIISEWCDVLARERQLLAEKRVAQERMQALLKESVGKSFLVSGYVFIAGVRFTSDGGAESWTYAATRSLRDTSHTEPVGPTEMILVNAASSIGGDGAIEVQYPGDDNRVLVMNLSNLVSFEPIEHPSVPQE